MSNRSNENILKVLIVEDEYHAQKELKRLLIANDHNILVLEVIDSVEDAIDWINNNPAPDLMFFDIQLADGHSFEVFKKVNTKAPVIFTTAYDEFAIQAFKVNSIDYLLKPLKQEELNSAIDKYMSSKYSEERNDSTIDIKQIEQLLLLNKPKFKSRFITKIGDQIVHISIDDIAFFKAEDNVTFVVTNRNKQYIIDQSLDNIVSVIDPDKFYRVNRSIITHINSIKKINKYFNSRLHLELEPQLETTVLISRVRVPDFLNWIDR